MTRTLADMTPAERANCVGRWCEHEEEGLVILAAVNHTVVGKAVAVFPKTGGWRWDNLRDLTPRLDLPRAWTPTGEPVPGDCEYAAGHVVEYADGQKDCRPRYREDSRQSALASAEELKDDGYVAMRRFVTDWEEA